MRAVLTTVFAALLVASAIRAQTPAGLPERASAWLASLDASQRRAASYDFDDDERFDLRLAPMGLEGLRRDKMTDAQWQAWLGVLRSTLSESGLRKVETIMSLEREVLIRDRSSLLGGIFGPLVHGEQRYFAALFGDPAPDAAWGLRFDGHHVSINWTRTAAGALSLTPLFLGAEPRAVDADWERGGLRALAEEEDRALALWNAFGPDQRTRSELPFEEASGPAGANRPLFLGEGGEPLAPADIAGIAWSELDDAQRVLLASLIDAYLSNFNDELAEARRAAIEAAGRDAIHFAWAGSLSPGEPGYYRIQGPTFLIEWDNSMAAADHVHTILREFDGDFGRDLLAEHYEREHGVAIAHASPDSGPPRR